MAIPAGVTLCTVRLPASVTWQGGSSPIAATLTPSRTLFHRRSNTPLEAVTGSATGPSGPGLVLLVPHSEQGGYRDAAGNSIASWEWHLTASYRNAANVLVNLRKEFVIPRGVNDIDLTLVADNTLHRGPQLGIDTDGTPYVIS